jgi:pimeloyl-ACP methyl ester carboxylesterase
MVNPMDVKPITLYGLGGLGADDRVFKYLSIDAKLIPIKWIKPIDNEDISSYAKRLANQIDEVHKFGIIGVSFGGMLAIELSKHVKPSFIILISSASKSSELPKIKSVFSYINVIRFLPASMLKLPIFIMNFMFGAKNKSLLKEIIEDTDPEFLKWALDKILQWNFYEKLQNVYSIHGSADKLIPLTNESSFIIENGGHFMIVDRANEISIQINDILSEYK